MSIVDGQSAGLGLAVHELHQDQVTAEVVRALIRRRCEPILLKGRVLAKWLYAEHEVRASGDIDLLVDPELFDQAETELRSLGFQAGQRGWQDVSRAFARPRDGAKVDLHRSLFGLEAPAEMVWSALNRETVPIEIAGLEVKTLSFPARAMHLATHAAQHGYERNEKSLEDLRRGCEQLGFDTWEHAAAIARELGAQAAVGTGLGLISLGAPLAARLGVGDVRSPAVDLHAAGAPPLVLGIESLAEENSNRARLAFIARKLTPSPAYMRRSSSLASAGPPGLLLAYLGRPFRLLIRLPGAVIAWRRVRAAAAKGNQQTNHEQMSQPQKRR